MLIALDAYSSTRLRRMSSHLGLLRMSSSVSLGLRNGTRTIEMVNPVSNTDAPRPPHPQELTAILNPQMLRVNRRTGSVRSVQSTGSGGGGQGGGKKKRGLKRDVEAGAETTRAGGGQAAGEEELEAGGINGRGAEEAASADGRPSSAETVGTGRAESGAGRPARAHTAGWRASSQSAAARPARAATAPASVRAAPATKATRSQTFLRARESVVRSLDEFQLEVELEEVGDEEEGGAAGGVN